MKLPSESLSIKQKIEEFDEWLTPQLHEIKGTEKFTHELEGISLVIDRLSLSLNNFSTINDCALEKIRDAAIEIAAQKAFKHKEDNTRAEQVANDFFCSFFNLLFLVTGATDNNLKNHFAIKLRQDGITSEFPEKIGRTNISFELQPFGNTITSKDVAKKLSRALVASIESNLNIKASFKTGINLRQYVDILSLEYISLILADRADVCQFWAICKAYIDCKSISREVAESLLTPLIIFKVRGSVSATAGHLPESILRKMLISIGLEPGVDFNISDAIIGVEQIVEEGKIKNKTRAYDFILPFAREGWDKCIFIQSQFYAGDSGSVSHKVIDQTISSRAYTLAKYPNAKFMEYLDGAGYFASLRGDLLHMMQMTNTHSFIQVRSLWIRLRRELQQIKFITPIEIEHAILRTQHGTIKDVKEILTSEEYKEQEIERGISYAVSNNLISYNKGQLSLDPKRKALARRLFIMDTIACNGEIVISHEENLKSIFIPGYGPSFGIRQALLAKIVTESIQYEVVSTPDYALDMEWLIEEKVIKKHF